MTVITSEVVTKLLNVVDAGLSHGLGVQKPGKMCVEAAVCYALGLPHGDDPQCVSRALRSLKIRLNDKHWSSPAARAKGLRRLAVAQLGSRDHLDDIELSKRVAELAIRSCVPVALRAAASIQRDPNHVQALRDAADKCERDGTEISAREAGKAAASASADAYASAYAAADAADAAAYASADAYADAADASRDKILSDFAEGVVQILIAMGAPGCQWLHLTEMPSAD